MKTLLSFGNRVLHVCRAVLAFGSCVSFISTLVGPHDFTLTLPFQKLSPKTDSTSLFLLFPEALLRLVIPSDHPMQCSPVQSSPGIVFAPTNAILHWRLQNRDFHWRSFCPSVDPSIPTMVSNLPSFAAESPPFSFAICHLPCQPFCSWCGVGKYTDIASLVSLSFRFYHTSLDSQYYKIAQHCWLSASNFDSVPVAKQWASASIASSLDHGSGATMCLCFSNPRSSALLADSKCRWASRSAS